MNTTPPAPTPELTGRQKSNLNLRRHGGAKPGAGRPLGSTDKNPRPLDVRTIAEQLIPLLKVEFIEMSMLDIIQWAARVEAANGHWRSAAQMAALALPYMLPKLTQIDSNVNVSNQPHEMSTESLEAILVENFKTLPGSDDSEG